MILKLFLVIQSSVSLPYKQRAFIIYDNDVTLKLAKPVYPCSARAQLDCWEGRASTDLCMLRKLHGCSSRRRSPDMISCDIICQHVVVIPHDNVKNIIFIFINYGHMTTSIGLSKITIKLSSPFIFRVRWYRLWIEIQNKATFRWWNQFSTIVRGRSHIT